MVMARIVSAPSPGLVTLTVSCPADPPKFAPGESNEVLGPATGWEPKPVRAAVSWEPGAPLSVTTSLPLRAPAARGATGTEIGQERPGLSTDGQWSILLT